MFMVNSKEFGISIRSRVKYVIKALLVLPVLISRSCRITSKFIAFNTIEISLPGYCIYLATGDSFFFCILIPWLRLRLVVITSRIWHDKESPNPGFLILSNESNVQDRRWTTYPRRGHVRQPNQQCNNTIIAA